MPGAEIKNTEAPILVQIEIAQNSVASDEEVRAEARTFLAKAVEPIGAGVTSQNLPNIASLTLDSPYHTGQSLEFRPYRLERSPTGTETLTVGGEEATALLVKDLPHVSLNGAWSSLHFSTGLKTELLAFSDVMLRLAEVGVDPNCIDYNRLILLHGEPGTGKTSLARALGQELSIRLRPRFPRACLAEVNAHSLFSRWFSESGKLVQAMFERLEDILEDSDCLVIVLIDEVESLGRDRASGLGKEPSDALKAVNAVLTRLDALKAFPNLLVLATSNLRQSLDPAFLDRVDLARECPLPDHQARNAILNDCLRELARTGLIEECPASTSSLQLFKDWEGLSGRRLRKLPLLALSRAVASNPSNARRKLPLTTFNTFLREAALDSLAENTKGVLVK